MTNLRIRPGKLKGEITPPPAKSDAHRALIATSLSGGDDSDIRGLPEPLSEDLTATRQCLDALRSGSSELDCRESGTTLRFLIPVAGALNTAPNRTIRFTGKGRLPYRPMTEYLDVLEQGGLTLRHPSDAFLPLELSGTLQAGLYRLPGHISSQYLSGLLMALPLCEGDTRIELTTPLQSAPYVQMTLKTLHRHGIHVDEEPGAYKISGPQIYQRAVHTIEKDFSQAAFWLTAAYAGCPVSVVGLPEKTVQGDRQIMDILDDFSKEKSCYVIDASQIPDLVPIVAVAATLTSAETRIIRAERLRFKESDRLKTTRTALWTIGADIEALEDGLLIRGKNCSRREKQLTGGTVDSYGDHRIAMALSIAALFTRDGIILKRPEVVRKSYPDFFTEFSRLGGDVRGINLGGSC